MDDSWVTPEVLAMAASGIPDVALSWARSVREGDAWSIWTGMDDAFRLTMSQMIVDASGFPTDQREELAEQFASRAEQTDEWDEVIEEPLVDQVQFFLSALGDGQIGSGSLPRPVGIDIEVINLIALEHLPKDEHGVAFLPPGEAVPGVSLVVRLTPDREWLVAGFAPAMPKPGNPPSFEPL